MPNGFTDGGGGFDFGALFDALLSSIVAAVEAIIVFLQQLVAAIARALNVLFAGEQAIFGFTDTGLTHIFKGLKNLLDEVFHVWVVRGFHHLLDLFNKLRQWARKLKAFLEKLRRLQQLQQAQAFRRFINLIQRIRRVLLIFRIFHLKFAEKLDNWLAGIEGTLIRRFFFLESKLNEVIFWLDLIFDPRGGMRRFPLFLGLMEFPETFLQVFTGRGLDFWYSKKASSHLLLPAQASFSQHYDTLRTDLATGGGDVGAWRQSFADTLDLYKGTR